MAEQTQNINEKEIVPETIQKGLDELKIWMPHKRYIQELLGHKSSKTTEIYTHVSTISIQNIKSPIDDL